MHIYLLLKRDASALNVSRILNLAPSITSDIKKYTPLCSISKSVFTTFQWTAGMVGQNMKMNQSSTMD